MVLLQVNGGGYGAAGNGGGGGAGNDGGDGAARHDSDDGNNSGVYVEMVIILCQRY